MSTVPEQGLHHPQLVTSRDRQGRRTSAVIDNLCFGGPLPSEPPHMPGGLSQLWLSGGYSTGGVVRAIHGDRWVRDHPFSNFPDKVGSGS
ncbi:hypothetical protein AB0F15_43960 [Amycolatopsis sp. NPDC026612]|uniref:hypothetical protein n=1 Tax=Amycolatopsis sp. NPDC026612 TaxID=3155466 RepID=UPI0033C08386